MDLEVLALIVAAKRKFPEQRVCQIIFNALDMVGKARKADGTAADQFYVGDDQLAEALRTFMRAYD